MNEDYNFDEEKRQLKQRAKKMLKNADKSKDNRKKRSRGITIIGILFMTYPLLFALSYIGPEYELKNFFNFWIIIKILAYVGLYFTVGINLLRLNGWARIFAFWLVLLPLLVNSYELITNLGSSNTSIDVISCSISLAVIIYLTRPKVKEQFK